MAVATPSRRYHHLPIALTSFVGRRQETGELKRLLMANRLVTLTGAGGVGKTRLALRVVAEMARTFADGTCLVELAELRDQHLVAHAVVGSLGIRESGRDPYDTLTTYLRERDLLLVLDNCEHVRDACAELVEKLLVAAPRLRILATSRQRLGVAGEQLFRVPSLTVPATGAPLVGGAGEEAVWLFAERARAVVPDFEITADNMDAVIAVCQRLDGIPLAIELAAARLRVLSVRDLLQRLDQRFDLLTSGGRTAIPRQRTLRALVDWSYELCSPTEREMWARLSVFAGGFDLEAVRRVCVDGLIDGDDVADLIAGLVDKSIVVRDEQAHAGRVRFWLLETIRQYGSAQLASSGEQVAVYRRHRDHYVRLAETVRADWFGRSQLQLLSLLHREHANLQVALGFSVAQPEEADTGLELATALYPFWFNSVAMDEGRRWIERLLARNPKSTAARLSGLWIAAAMALYSHTEFDAAHRKLTECREMACRDGDSRNLAYVLLWLGVADVCRGDTAHGITLLHEAFDRHRAAGDIYGAWIALLRLTIAIAPTGDPEAIILGERSLAIAKAHGAESSRAHSLLATALAWWRREDLDHAVALLHEGLHIDDPWGIANCLELLAWVAADEHQYDRAARLIGVASSIWRSSGGSLGLVEYLREWHDRCVSAARRALGDRRFAAAVREGAELGLRRAVAYALNHQVNSGREPAEQPADAVLTRREVQIAELAARGLTNREIADELVIAQRTAETHMAHILDKLGFSSRVQVADWFNGRGTTAPM